jgi:hypothetical protein
MKLDPKEVGGVSLIDYWVARVPGPNRFILCKLEMEIRGSALNPLAARAIPGVKSSSPAIDYIWRLKMRLDQEGNPKWTGESSHDGFPSYIFSQDGKVKSKYSAVNASPLSLLGTADDVYNQF